ncbi:MAG: hypothetical protein J6J16_07175 [Lachnospiraceae bacterium]|nr:hypothetical protein [Lachnospiraceae bacterium]
MGESNSNNGGTIISSIRFVISVLTCLFCLVIITRVNGDYIETLFNFDDIFQGVERSIRIDNISYFIGEHLESIFDGINLLLIMAILIFAIAEYESIILENILYGYKLHITGMIVCIFAYMIYFIDFIVIFGGEFVRASETVVFLVGLIFIILFFVFDLIVYFKIKSHLNIVKNKMLYYIIIFIGILSSFDFAIINVVANSGDYLKYRETMENQGSELSQTVEYQMGNYYAQNGVYGDGNIYIITDGQDIGREKNENIIFRIDENGYHEEIYSFFGYTDYDPYIGYYDGCLYIQVVKDDDSSNRVKIIKISVDEKKEETLIENNDYRYIFAVVENKLYYYVKNKTEPITIMCFDLDNNSQQVYDSGIDDFRLDNGLWLGRFLYNQRNIAYFCEESCCYANSNDWCMRQFYKNYIYNFSYDVNSVNYYPDLLFREDITKDEGDNEVIDKYVQQFNIYNSTIYYVKGYEDNLELWSCAMDGTDKEYIATLDIEEPYIIYRDNGEEFYKYHICNNMIVGEKYVVCDFGDIGTNVDERIIVNLEGGTIEKIVFE